MDLHSIINPGRGVSPVAITTGNATLTSQIVDRANYRALEFLFASGAITDGVFTVTVYESDAADMTGETAVADADLLGSEPAFDGAVAADDNAVKRVGYKGSKRYVRAKAVQTGATTGGFIVCVVLQAGGRYSPVA